MDDYVFLEDIGRVVESQGSGIVQGGLTPHAAAARGGSTSGGNGRGGRHNGRGGIARGGAANGRRSGTKSKREILQMQLGFKGIRMDLMSDGMQRQRMNQSKFNSR